MGRQWWNRDTGYGLCDDCIRTCGLDAIGMGGHADSYGVRGVHWDTTHEDKPTIPEGIRRAYEAHIAAATAVMDAVKLAYPLGCTVELQIGGRTINGEVIGHSGSWWYQPGEVRIRNLKSGKVRKFNAPTTVVLTQRLAP
jgi:hypothetical protein